MKTKISHFFSSCLVLTLVAACGGKDNGSGGAAPVPTPKPNTNTVTIPTNNNTVTNPGSDLGKKAYDNLKAWYKAADNTAPGTHMAYKEKTSSSGFMASLGICGNGALIRGCEAATMCFIKTSAGVNKGVVKLKSNGFAYDGCDVSKIDLYKKSEDQALKEAVLGSSGQHLLVEKTQQIGSIYYVYYAAYPGSLSIVAAYEINTSLPAILNPIQKQELVGGQIVTTKKIHRFF